MLILIAVAVVAGLGLTTTLVLEEGARLDSEFARLQGLPPGLRLSPTAEVNDERRRAMVDEWDRSFLSRGQLPSTAELAAFLQVAARDQGLDLVDLRLVGGPDSHRVKLSLRGEAGAWLNWVAELSRNSDPVIFSDVAAALTDRGDYRFDVEVGYGIRP